ncbi:MAG TPA: NUDIX domain-containing protein [Solirubrobacteraceae bacterium]|nr:NUDIX domain-containing protein [Solirubrobacteraceae bacterium]
MMALLARVPVSLRRRGYRLAYALLCVYWFVRRPECHGVKCVLTDGELVLLVRHTYGPAQWDLPGGALKSGEEPRLTARREMHEELGVDITAWESIGTHTGRMHSRHDVVHCFHAELHEPTLTLDLGELVGARWFALAAVPADLGVYVEPILAMLPRSSAGD